jgi:two-component system, NarL family, nitrate/nitrite response regulator NarL
MADSQDSSLTMQVPIRVLLVEGCQLVLWAYERLFEADSCGIVIVGKTEDPADALRIALRIQPDIVLLGLDLGSKALSLIPNLVKQPRIRVVVRAATADPDTADRAMLSGARGLLLKEDSVDVIIKAIRKVHAGELWLDRAMGGRIFGLLTRHDVPSDPDTAKIASLTIRERNIVATLAHVGSARHRKVATLLGMSEHTLRNHLSHIYGKLELTGHFELYLYAKRHGLDQSARH